MRGIVDTVASKKRRETFYQHVLHLLVYCCAYQSIICTHMYDIRTYVVFISEAFTYVYNFMRKIVLVELKKI